MLHHGKGQGARAVTYAFENFVRPTHDPAAIFLRLALVDLKSA